MRQPGLRLGALSCPILFPPNLRRGAPVHAGGEEVVLPAITPVLSGTPGATLWAGPDLGQHTEEVLREELGMSGAEIAKLRSCGAI